MPRLGKFESHRVNTILTWTSVLCSFIVSPTSGADEPLAPTSTASRVIARVGTQTITLADIDFFLARTLITVNDSPSIDDARPPLSPVTLGNATYLIARQRQALATLRGMGQASTIAEMDAAIMAGASNAHSDGNIEQIVQELCQRHRIEPARYRDTVDFRLAWPRYLTRHLTQENLVRHFEKQPDRFDGSRFKVDMISIAVAAGQSPHRDDAAQRLDKLRSQFVANPPDWEQLRPLTADQTDQTIVSGRWVRGSGDWSPELITPLLELEIGQISPPIHTATGVHVIRLLEREAGKFSIDQVRGDVRAHMLLVLLEYLAEQSQQQLPLVAEEQGVGPN